MESTLPNLLCYLVSGWGNNFYARILTALQLRETLNIPAMAVVVHKRRFILMYNPEWFKAASYDLALAVIEHEVCHLIWEHVPRKLELYAQALTEERKEELSIVFPFAIDMAVNTLLEDMNPFWKANKDDYIFPDDKRFGLPRHKSFEWYVEALIEKFDKQIKLKSNLQKMIQEILDELNSSGGGKEQSDGEEKEESDGKGQSKPGSGKAGRDLLSNHVVPPQSSEEGSPDDPSDSIPDDGSVEGQLSLADELRNKLKSLVSKAVEEHTRSRGTLPAGLQERINSLMKNPVIPFTKILRNWVITTQKYRRKRSPLRMKRRTVGIPELCSFPGSSKERKFIVVWCIDTSGSMGSEELELGLNELRGLQKADPEITIHVIEADAEVEHEYILDRPETKINHEVHGRGGTAFDPALVRAQQLRPDICFYFTDGYAPAPNLESRVGCPFAWVITPRGVCPDENWGHKIETKNH